MLLYIIIIIQFNAYCLTKVYQIQETIDYIYIVEDNIPSENDLISCICNKTKYTQYDVVCIICFILNGLYLKDEDILYIHKNIKPDNIYLKDPDNYQTIILTDYGISKDYFVLLNIF